MEAARMKEAGDIEGLMGLAVGNGLDRGDVEDYVDGAVECLCTPATAALGKLDLEAAELGLESQLKDWKDYVAQLVMESKGEGLCRAVFSPDRHLKDVMAAGLKKASENRVKVHTEIIRAAGLPESAAYIGMCGRDELREIVTGYYLGGKA